MVNNGTGAVGINVNGAVTGGIGNAISTYSFSTSGLTQITLFNGADVSATSGNAIFNDGGDSSIAVLAGATLVGDVSLGAGSDNLVFNGADITQFGVLDGGGDAANADFLTFMGGITGSLVGADLQNWDYLTISNNSNISFSDNAVTADVALRVFSGATLDASGGLAITGGLQFASTGNITMVDGIAGDILSVSNVYVGLGNFMLDVDYGNDVADSLVLNSIQPTAAPATITLNDITTGPITGNDILLVDTGGSNTGDFDLAGGPVVMGLYEYDLALVGTEWLLQGGISAAAAPYEASASVLLGIVDLSTYAQRVGQREQMAGQALWGRMSGDFGKTTPVSSFTDFSVNSRSFDVEAGTDYLVSTSPLGEILVGLNASYGLLSAIITTPGSAASVNAQGFGLGASATWQGTDGLYADLQGGVDWIFTDFSSDSDGALVNDHASMAYAASLEIGARMDMGGGSSLIPQVQLSWSRLIGGSFTDSTAAANVVDLGVNERLVVRIGLAYEVEIEDDQTFYAIANLLHDFSSANTVVAAGTDLISTDAATWGEIGIGGSFALQNNVSVFGEVAAKTGFANMQGNFDLSATGGLRVTW